MVIYVLAANYFSLYILIQSQEILLIDEENLVWTVYVNICLFVTGWFGVKCTTLKIKHIMKTYDQFTDILNI